MVQEQDVLAQVSSALGDDFTVAGVSVTPAGKRRVARITVERPVAEAVGDTPIEPLTLDEIADALTSAGYSTNTRQVGTGMQICQHHCPVAHVATEFPELCEAETAVFTELLGTHVQRLATIANGDCACTTHVPIHPPPGGTTEDRPGAVADPDTQPVSPRATPNHVAGVSPEDIAADASHGEGQGAAGPFAALGFKLVHDEHGAMVFVRVYQGRVRVGDVLLNTSSGQKERIAKAALDPNPRVTWDDWVADYGRIRDLIAELPGGVPVLATTATDACQRVTLGGKS